MKLNENKSKKKYPSDKVLKHEENNTLLKEQSTDLIFRLNSKGKCLDFQTGQTKNFTIPTNKITGTNIKNIFPKDISNNLIKTITQSISTGKAQSINYEVKLKTGIKFFEAKVVSIGNNEVLFFSRDITESKIAEAELTKSLDRYKKITESITDYLYTVTLENGVPVKTTHKPSCFVITGFTSEELEANPYLWLDMICPSDRQLVIDNVNKLLAGNSVERIEHRIIRKDGTLCWVESQIVPHYDGNGKITYYDGLIKNINERKLSEQLIADWKKRFELISTSSKQVVYDYNITTGDVFWSGSLEQVFGYKQEDLGNIRLWEELVHPKDRENCLKIIHDSIKSKSEFELEYEFKLKDGNYITIYDSGFTIFDNQNNAVSLMGVMQDISARKKTERALLDSENRYKTLAESSFEAIAIIEDEKFIDVNKQMLEMFKYSVDEMIGKSLDMITSEESLELAHSYIKEKKIDPYEIIGVKKDGTKFPIELRPRYLGIENKEYRITIIRDVAELRHNEELLNKRLSYEAAIAACSKELLTQEPCKNPVNEALKHLLKVSDAGRTYIFVNKGNFENLMMDQIYEICAEGVQPEMGNLLLHNLPYDEYGFGYWKYELPKGKAILGFVKDFPELPRKIFEAQDILSILIIPVFVHNKWYGFIGFDETRKKRIWDDEDIRLLQLGAELIGNYLERKIADEHLIVSEKRFRSVWENAADGMRITDKDGFTIDVNDAYCTLTGMQREDLVGKHFTVAYAHILPNTMAEYNKSFNNETTVRVLEGKLTFKNDKFIYADISFSFIYSDKGEKYLLGVFRDVTSKKIVEQALIKAKENAEKSDRLKSEFLAQVSHEIRTPLNSVLSFSSLLKTDIEDKVSDELKIGFSIIENGGKRLLRTIDLILNMSQIQTGNLDLRPVPTDIDKDILKNIYQDFKTLSINRNIGFNYVSNNINDKIVIDRYSVSQIFVNLIDNAFKYTPKGKIDITLYKNSENKVCVDIDDTGIGMSKEFQKNLFTPFTQEDTGYTRKYEGTGLGLALVRKYCEVNNAEISIVSEKGKGTTFTVVFHNQ